MYLETQNSDNPATATDSANETTDEGRPKSIFTAAAQHRYRPKWIAREKIRLALNFI